MEKSGQYQNITTREEIKLEQNETKMREQMQEREREQKEAQLNAASEEESAEILNETLKDLKKRKIERLKNASDIKN